MFRLNRNKPAKSSGERIDFKFSSFKALQVPKGWDKLFVSIVSVESGKTVTKSSKAHVQNGNCQWTDTLTESIWFSQNESSKDLDDCFIKFVVAMGSARTGMLGEATVNMTGYMSSSSSVLVSLPLKKSNYGTILQVKIRCLAPRAKLRDGESKERISHVEEVKVDSQDSDVDSVCAQSVRSSSSKDTGRASQTGEPESRETSFSASGSHHSYDSADAFLSRENFSPSTNISGNGHNPRQDSTSSHGNYPVDDASQSPHSSFNSRHSGSGNHSQNNWQEHSTSSLRISNSSKNLLEAAEDAIEELRAEAKMWERNARKLMLDLDILRKEFSDQSKNQANLDMELSAACVERDGLKKEVEALKLLLQKSTARPTIMEDSTFQYEGSTYIQKELENEIKFQRESNANLALQLKRSQESNIELVSLLQELELEKSILQSKSSGREESIQENTEENKELTIQLQLAQESERELTTQLQHMQEAEKDLKAKVQMLEHALEGKNHMKESGGIFNSQALLTIETEYKSKLIAKEEEIFSLEAKLSEFQKESHSAEMGSIDGGDANLIREIEALKYKLQELERDCNELTDENLELLFKLKEVKNNSMTDPSAKSATSFEAEVGEQETRCDHQEGNLNNKVLGEIEDNYDLLIEELKSSKMELELKVTELGAELSNKRSEIAKLEGDLRLREKEISVLTQSQRDLEAKIAELDKEKIQLEENMKAVVRESDITSKCLNDLQNDLVVLSSSVGTHISANKMLERKSSELESGKCELQLRLSELEEENEQLSVCISGLEAQLRHLTDESESSRLELEHSKSYVENLHGEITRLRNEKETQKVDLEQKLQEMQSRWLEVQEECEYSRRTNQKLQATTDNLIEECSSLRKLNEELREQKLDLYENCTQLEAKLRESSKSFSECSEKVGILEENLSSVLEDIASKEKSLVSELDALLEENRKHKEKVVVGESLLNEIYTEKTAEVENLQQQVQHLTEKISAISDERDRTVNEAIYEVSCLREDKGKLESSLQEVQSKLKWTEDELNTDRVESDEKAHALKAELSASKENQEMLIADRDRMLKLLENYRSSEEKFKTAVNSLELKFTVSEYERQQLLEETTNLKVKLQKLALLQDELAATKFEKEKVEASLHQISGECEELKAEKVSFVEKISTLQTAVSELDECKRSRVSLEEKLLQMEGDLLAREASFAQEAELRNELSRISRTNSQSQRKIQQLEKEKDEYLRRSHTLEEEMKLMKEEKHIQREKAHSVSKTNAKVNPIHDDMMFSKNEVAKSTNNHRDNRRKPSLKNDQVQELVKDRQKTNSIQHHKEGGNVSGILDQHPQAVDVVSFSKIQSLENELAEAMEANKLYKSQLNRLMSEGRSLHSEGEVVAKERLERTKSSLEAELKDIRERYFHMSLQYAEVEHQREELVMKLKAAKTGKRWFS